jgi:hypothetical protein
MKILNIIYINVNNYGFMRTDDIIFLHSGNNIIPKYIEFKHFNKNFPENHNIKYEKNGEWKTTNINYLTKKLNEVHKYYNNQKNEIEKKNKKPNTFRIYI